MTCQRFGRGLIGRSGLGLGLHPCSWFLKGMVKSFDSREIKRGAVWIYVLMNGMLLSGGQQGSLAI